MRRWNRRAAAVGTAFTLALGQLIISSPAAQAADPVTLNLLTINDFHGRIDTNTVKFAGTVEGLRQGDGASGANTLLIGAGDFIGASLFASSVQQDQPTIDVMNELGLDVSAVGNHEFDQGWADLRDRVIGPAGTPNAQWDYLGANVYDSTTGQPVLPEYATYQVGGVTVGVIGAVTVETPTLVSPDGVSSLKFGDPVTAINRVADQLTDGDPANGEAQILVASFHEGAPQGGQTLDQNVAASPAFAEIVNDVSPKVAAIVTGHTHQAYAFQAPVPGDPSRTRPIVQTGSYGANVGQIKLTVDRDTDTVTGSTVANVPRVGTADATLLAQYPARLTPIKATVDAALAVANQRGNVPVGSITADITTAYTPATPPDGVNRCVAGAGRDDRASESTLGNLVANALLAQLKDRDRGGAEIAVVNPGGLRSDLCFAANTASWSEDGPGLVMYGEANAVLPFANDLFVTSLTGAQFKTALEQQWQRDAAGNIPTRPYLQLGLSDNVTYTFDPSAPEGSRITSVTIDDRPLDPAKTYRIGSFSFLLQGGDNFRIFTAGTDTKDSGLVDRDAWIDYLKANPGLAPDFARHAVKVTNQPTIAAAGATVTFDVAGLGLTSLGAPANSSLEAALLPIGGGAPAAKEAFAVSGGAARVEFDVPAQIAAGAWNLVLTATPSGTTVTIPLTITATSSVTLTADRSSQVYGAANPLTLTATVVTSDAGAAGSVEFRTGSTVLASVPVVGGQAAFTLPSSTPAGPYPIVAHYTGAGGVPPADSAAVTVTVTPAGSVTVLAPALVVPFLGTILVGAVGLNNGQPARGSVEIRDNGGVVGSTAVQSHGLFVFLAPRPARGQHSYTATFVPGDPANITGSTSNPVVVRR